jgi:hypothetical protein
MEVVRHLLHHEGQEEEVEGVEGPAEQAGVEGGALRPVERPKLVDHHHARPPDYRATVARRSAERKP